MAAQDGLLDGGDDEYEYAAILWSSGVRHGET